MDYGESDSGPSNLKASKFKEKSLRSCISQGSQPGNRAGGGEQHRDLCHRALLLPPCRSRQGLSSLVWTHPHPGHISHKSLLLSFVLKPSLLSIFTQLLFPLFSQFQQYLDFVSPLPPFLSLIFSLSPLPFLTPPPRLLQCTFYSSPSHLLTLSAIFTDSKPIQPLL